MDIKFIQAGAENVPQPDNYFDKVMATTELSAKARENLWKNAELKQKTANTSNYSQAKKQFYNLILRR
jgi:hypothetical protein